jgi:hypothetical protein
MWAATLAELPCPLNRMQWHANPEGRSNTPAAHPSLGLRLIRSATFRLTRLALMDYSSSP